MESSNDLYGGFTLKKGDNDKKNIWAGKKRISITGNYVEALQTDLKRIGVYLSHIDGDFGKLTHVAVQRFQWNAKNMAGRIKNNVYTKVSKTFSDRIDGIVGNNVKKELLIWKLNAYKATGDLIRIKETTLNNISLSQGFKKINHPNIKSDEIIVSLSLLKYLKTADAKAKELSLDIKLNQTVRVNGIKVSGAVVRPASKSQHHIGHAFDCNIVDNENWNNSIAFANKQETENAKEFIKAMKSNGLRWGGDFSSVDTPHFDKQIAAGSSDYDYKYFFNQRMISEKQNILLKTW